MPGGIDIHTHIAGRKLIPGGSCAQKITVEIQCVVPIAPEAVSATVPSTYVTGYRYAKLGYTTVVEAAMPPLKAPCS